MASKDNNKYKKVEALLKLYPEIPLRIRNAERFLQLGEEIRAKEIEELKIKKVIIEEMMEYLKEKCEIGYNVIDSYYFKKKSAVAVSIELNISEHHVHKVKRNMINRYLMSFIK